MSAFNQTNHLGETLSSNLLRGIDGTTGGTPQRRQCVPNSEVIASRETQRTCEETDDENQVQHRAFAPTFLSQSIIIMISGPLHRLALGLLPVAGAGFVCLCQMLFQWSFLVFTLALGALAVWLGWDFGIVARQRDRWFTPFDHQTPLSPEIAQKVRTFFYPGLGGSWMQALRYVGPTGLNGSSLPSAPLLLYSVQPVNPPEVILASDSWPALSVPWFFTVAITRIGVAMHGILSPATYFLNVPLTSFAQRPDQEQLRAALASNPRREQLTILAGSSRGASTVLCAVSQMSREQQDEIGLVVLEGAFDTVPNTAHARFGTGIGSFLTWVLGWATAYDPAAPTPLDLVKSFPAHVPVAFITSKADTVVPMAHTLALRDAVVAARGGDTTHVHTLVLEKSGHSSYVNQDLGDQTLYRAFMDSLYRKYVLK